MVSVEISLPGGGEMYDGIEIDMLSLGDADCIVVTQYHANMGAQSVLIDGGKESDAPAILDFLRRMNKTNLWAAICSHLHNDHARGLIKIVEHPSITIQTGWMHDIRTHVLPDALRRASTGYSQEAEGVRQVLDNTRDLASAFASRGVTPTEPFAGQVIAGCPYMLVLGPTEQSYEKAITEFTDEVPNPLFAALLGASRRQQGPISQRLSLLPPPTNPYAVPLAGTLKNMAIEQRPTTQPFNKTSTILGVNYLSQKLLFTADAGSNALDSVPADWQHLDWMQVPHHGSDGNLSKSNAERFCPKFANISSCGDDSHPSRAIVNALTKLGSRVFSTHKSGDLWFKIGNVPPRTGYIEAIPLLGSVETVINLNYLSSLNKL
jgi:beta-lactamase superfamily II metal-dependent hydrolase